jgi:hypothetical protein
MATLFQKLKSGSKESRNARIQELEHKLHLQDERYTRLEKKNKELLGCQVQQYFNYVHDENKPTSSPLTTTVYEYQQVFLKAARHHITEILLKLALYINLLCIHLI